MLRLRLHSVTLTIAFVFALALLLSLSQSSLLTDKVRAQGQSQLVPLVTDQTPLALPNTFGMAGGGVVNQAGDYAFFGNGGSAMFYRPAGAAAPVRVMQMGDEVPGFPGSRADIIQTLRLNSSGVLAFRPDIFQTNGVIHGALFTFDGTSLHQVVSGTDLAPGGGGAPFGRNITVAGLNDSGDLAFTAPLVAPGSTANAQTTLYIVPGGGTPVRVVGLGDAAPGIVGGTFSTLIPGGFNNQGEVLFTATVAVPGPSTVQGLFVGSTTGIRKVVVTGDARPEGGPFTPPTNSFINNTGEVAFQAGALYVNTPVSGTFRPVPPGAVVPAPVNGNIGPSQTLLAFNDAGDLAFIAGIVGVPSINNFGLFRFRPAVSPNPPNPLELVAYSGQAAPGTTGGRFASGFTSAVSINSSGVISFRALLTASPILNGIFQQSGTNAPVNIALEGQATTLAGGGSYSLSFAATQTLADGSVCFRSDVVGGAADYAEVLVSGGATTVLMTTADTLPAGERVSLRSFRVGAAGDNVGFLAQHPGGAFSLAMHNIATQSTSVVASDHAVAPGTGGGLLRITSRNTVFIDDGGRVAFAAQIIGGAVPGTTGVFVASPGSGLTKVAVNGDVVPGTGGRTLSQIAFTSVTPSPINGGGQVVFVATLLPPSPGPTSRAVCVWTPGIGLLKVAATGESVAGATITGFPGNFSMDNLGHVAFVATTSSGQGIYVGSPGGTTAKVVASGDPGPSGSTFLAFQTPGFNDDREVAFMATLTGGPGGGVFIGSPFGPPVALALNGSAAPAGGNFSITAARPDVLINFQHDVAFRANLVGGTADSGYFIRRGSGGTLQAAVLQGQPAPGTTGVFDTMLNSINSLFAENFQLGPDGDLAFQNSFLVGDQRLLGTWHLKTDNTLEEIIVRGTVAPEFGGGTATSTLSTAWNSGGRYPIWARVAGGTFVDGIFLFVPTVSTNTPAGTNVPVGLTDATTGTAPVTMTFDSVTQAGETSLTTSSGGPALPTAFALGSPAVFYNLETTATFTGSIGVCIDFSSVSFPAGATLRLLHFENGAWVDVTTSGPSGNVICGSVTSLSPFTVVQSLNTPPVARTKNITVSAGGSCQASVTASQVDDGSSDSDSGDTIGLSLDSTGPFSLGAHQVTLTVTDSYGATSSAVATVTVVDTTPPVMTLNGGNMAVELGAVFDDPGATASDNCAGSVAVITSSSVNVNSVGAYSIYYNAQDPANNHATQVTRIVDVIDTTAPTLSAPLASSAYSDINCQAAIPNVLPQVVASDLGGTVTLSQNPTAGTLVGVGPHTITITGKDPSNNSGSVTTTFTVVGSPTFTVSVSPSSVKRGKQVAFNLAFKNCASGNQALTLKMSLTRPGSSTLIATLPLTLHGGQTGSLSVPLTIPGSTPTGSYTLTLDVYVGGVKIGTSTAQLTVTP